jgi:L-lysine 2,3-aminomutase
LFEIGVLPYYLHLLDHVAGAAHFEVPEPRVHRPARKRCWRACRVISCRDLVREVAHARVEGAVVLGAI